jgi:small-conductance mechanosensitive channel
MLRDIVLFLEHMVSMLGDNHYLQATVAVAIAVIASKLADLLLSLVKRLTRKTETRIDDLFIDALHRPLAVTVLMVGLGAATLLLDMHEKAEFATIASLRTILVLVWIQFAMKVVRFICRMVAERPGRKRMIQPATLPLFDNLTLLIAIALGTYMVLQVWSVDVTGWLASAGIVGLALSFAAKDTLANLFAGVFILADSPYRIGDYVVLDSGERGKVTDIGIRSTRMITRDDVEVTIPNAVMGNSKIYNETGGPHDKFRIRIPIMVCYGEDLDKVRATLMEVATNNAQVCTLPEPRVRYRAFADSGVTLEMLCWVDEPVLRGIVTDRLVVNIHTLFHERDITFPYPRQELFLGRMGPSPGADT